MNVSGEQLITQLFRCIPQHAWLFKYGRVPMSFVFAEWLWRVRLFRDMYTPVLTHTS
jgi:hypothetical protein